MLGGSHGRIEVLLPQKLADVASGKLVLDTSGAWPAAPRPPAALPARRVRGRAHDC